MGSLANSELIVEPVLSGRLKWLVMRQKRRVPWCPYPLEFTPVFSQVPAEIPTGHLSGSLSGCRWRDLYQGAIGNWTGIPTPIKTRKQIEWNPVSPVVPPIQSFTSTSLSTSAKFFSEKDQRSSRCWSSLIVYVYIRTCERNRPSPKHSCG